MISRKNTIKNTINKQSDAIAVGIDVGSRTTKAVLLNQEGIITSVVKPTSWDPGAGSREVFTEALSKGELELDDPVTIFSTGYGRESVPCAVRNVTEITCHARGAVYVNPDVRTVIDIGGQDAKVISVDPLGFAQDFVMNDRCAAGTGRFLEFMALSIGLPLEKFASVGRNSQVPAEISSMCTVFAESEMLSLKARGSPQEDVIAGLHYAIARRMAGMVAQVGSRAPILFTGGVALNPTMCDALRNELETEVLIPEDPVIIGALGAAVLALESLQRGEYPHSEEP